MTKLAFWVLMSIGLSCMAVGLLTKETASASQAHNKPRIDGTVDEALFTEPSILLTPTEGSDDWVVSLVKVPAISGSRAYMCLGKPDTQTVSCFYFVDDDSRTAEMVRIVLAGDRT